MSFVTLTQEEIHKLILATATKLVSNDLVNEYKDSRYQFQETGKEGIRLDMAQAASDAGELVVACLLEAKEREFEMDALEAEEAAAIEAAEEAQDKAVAEAERASEVQYANSGVEAQPCESPRSSSKTSASTRRSKQT